MFPQCFPWDLPAAVGEAPTQPGAARSWLPVPRVSKESSREALLVLSEFITTQEPAAAGVGNGDRSPALGVLVPGTVTHRAGAGQRGQVLALPAKPRSQLKG